MSILFGTQNVSDIFIGASPVSNVFLGTDLVWQKDTGIWTLFDSGYVNSIGWNANVFPRPNYTSQGGASLNYVESDGYMRMGIGDNSSTYTHYAVVSTQNTVRVPATATTLNIRAWRTTTTGIYVYIAVLPTNASTCINTGNGGACTSSMNVSNTVKLTYSLTLPDTVKGGDYVVCLTARGQANAANRYMYIDQVWFE